MKQPRTIVLAMLSTLTVASPAIAQSLVCPQVSADTTFAGTTMETECSATVTTGCTSKAGVTWNPGNGAIQLPVTAGNFQSPPGAAVDEDVLFAAIGDFDRDGWDDIAAADSSDKIFVMRNQTITCGTSGCTGNSSTAPTVQTIPAAWWNTITNKRASAFRFTTTTTGTQRPLKASPGSTSLPWTPMAAGDFDGDGWSDFIALSYTHYSGGFPTPRWATAARLYLNTRNCKNASNQPCGVGMLCGTQTANGTCSGQSGLTSGTPFTETQLSCTTTDQCPNFQPTFATYDMRTGATVTAQNTTSSSSPVTYKPGDFGPISRPTTNTQVLDWDGDGDLDLLFGHGPSHSYTCPGSLCTTPGKTFYAGIQVWLNDCAQSGSWNPTTKSCAGYIPRFSRNDPGSCNGTACTNADTLIPSSAHNTPAIAPNLDLRFDYTNHKVPVFAYQDIDNDGDRDLVLGSIGCCSTGSNSQYKLRIYKNTSGLPFTHMLDTANPIILSTTSGTYPGFEGALTAVFVHDFSGDGLRDIITGTDAVSYSGSIGGRTRYWRNTGNPLSPFGMNWPTCSATPATCVGCSASCNPNPTAIISQSCGSSSCSPNPGASPYPTFSDFDNGLMIDYDHDPASTKDIIMTNGAPVASATKEFYVFPNRGIPASVPACGAAISGKLPPPAGESTVTGACITPTATFGNATSSVRWYLSNEDPANYQLACTQTQAGLTPASCCVSFATVTGKDITWKAVLDSSTADDTLPNPCTIAGASSPVVAGVDANYTYNNALQHYRAGVVVSDGVSYVGSFRQPGNRGHFYGLAAGDGTTYYDAAAKIDAQGSRNIYTGDNVGASINPIAFSTANGAALQAPMGASSAAEASTVAGWVLGNRFGVTGPQKLGAVMNSTPAILTPPFRPGWYTFLNAADKALYDAFSTGQASRVPLALFASMDGMIHAVISIATDITNTINGTEAWAFVPPYVAANMKADYIATTGTGTLTVTAYPDGSPTLLDYKTTGGTIATVVLVGDGAGGGSLTALDVTNTVNPATFAVSTIPDPLWSHKPGDANAGKATGKPAVARVNLAGSETFVVVAGTGRDSSDPSKGKVVAGYNLESGALLWKFEMDCALTSDITVFETDDDLETGTPTLDGYTDRAVFADYCGNVYKIDPAQDLAGGWMDNVGYGSIVLADSNGVSRRALFSTTVDTALGGTAAARQRPIVGTIGAKSDTATDIVLYFGTGGLEAYDPTKVNAFYAVRAKDGTIRNTLPGTCATQCEKFYGGVVITSESIIIQRTVDPVIGGVGACDYGTTKVEFLSGATFAQTDLIDTIGGNPISASAGPLFGDAGALYFATVSGEIKRIGTPRAATAGADTAGSTMQNSSSGGAGAYGGPFTLMGWRVVL